jgi:hypothetical protein
MQVPVEHFVRHGRAQDVAAAGLDPDARRYVEALDIAP